MPDTLCVILHYGSEADTRECLDSLVQEETIDIVVVDNDPAQSYSVSEDSKTEALVVRTGGAAGFAEGNNIGVARCLLACHKFILLLNNDTVVQKRAIERLKETASLTGVGAVGPCMPYASAPSEIWACGGCVNRRNLKIYGHLEKQSASPYEVDYLPGAAILCRSDVWQDVGGLPEDYFLAYEEAEFALRVKRLGFKVMVVPDSVVLHKVGMSSEKRPEYFYNEVRNKITFGKYLYGVKRGFLFAVVVTALSFLSRPLNLKRMMMRFSLWFLAVIDEAKGESLDRQQIINVRDRAKARWPSVT